MNIKRIIKRELKKKRKEFKPHCVSIIKLCEKENQLDYCEQIFNRIFREYDKNEELGDYIRVDLEKGDILLDDYALMMFLDILEGYFDKDYIIGIWRNLREANKASLNDYQLDHLYDETPTKELKKALSEYRITEVRPEQEKAKQMVIVKVENEIKKRKPLFSLLYRVKDLCATSITG